jgi:pimeloyl-ACP methyl ester carboxylesterase
MEHVMLSNELCSKNSARDSNRLCIITMVHGTWGGAQASSWWHALYRAALALYRAARALFRAAPPDPAWYNEGSQFRSRLESELRKENIVATFRIFQWSGGNSVRDRGRAADELSHQLASDPDNANSIVIAHSHGGNVAFLAISKLGDRGANIHLITLATPFVRVFPTRHGETLKWVGIISFLNTIGLGLFLLNKVVQVPEPLNGTFKLLGPSDWLFPDVISDISDIPHISLVSYILALPAWLVIGVLSYLLVHLFLNPSPRLGQLAEQIKTLASRLLKIAKLEQLAEQIKAWAWRPFKIAKLANYDSTGPLAPNLLVIRGIDDEAAFILACGSIATAISRLAVRFLSSAKAFQFIVVCHLGRIFLHNHVPVWFDHYFLQPGMFVLTTFICFFLLAPSLFNCVFGTEFLIGAARCEIAHDSTPDSTRARIVTLKTPDQRPGVENGALSALNMHHRIYNYPSCGREIVKWISERV